MFKQHDSDVPIHFIKSQFQVVHNFNWIGKNFISSAIIENTINEIKK